ncbi:MAG: hypothetical protein QOE10_2108, partial [Gaiellales bacterium]|nr:hypothetical protein [Gaiellales bacterium]
MIAAALPPRLLRAVYPYTGI